MTKLDAAQWAEVRGLYQGGELAVRDIAARFGIVDRTILARARRDGWERRSEIRGKPVGASGPSTPVPPGHPTRRVRQALIRRLYKAIDIKLKQWEDRMASGDALSAADSERMAKEITTMIKGFETVAEAEGAIEKRDAQPTGPDATRTDGGRASRSADRDGDALRLRREVAERLERLRVAGRDRTGAE